MDAGFACDHDSRGPLAKILVEPRVVQQDVDQLLLDRFGLQGLGTHRRVSVQGVDDRTLDFGTQVGRTGENCSLVLLVACLTRISD